MSLPETNIVHETEVQRRHARVKLPVQLVIVDTQGDYHTLPIKDLSASGLGISSDTFPFEQGKFYSGELLFHLNTVEFRMPVNFTVVHCSETGDFAGCEFNDLNNEQISLLRLFLSKYIAGDLVTDDDILTTLSRENFTRNRKDKSSGELTGWKKLRAVSGTALAACLSVLLLSFIAYSLYQNYFVTMSITAMVNVETMDVQAPSDGYFNLVADIKKTVAQDAVIATITSPAAEFLNNNNIPSISSENISSLMPHVSNSIIKSPCQGRILRTNVENNTYVNKGDVLFELINAESQPYITAVFKYNNADDLAVGKNVILRYPAEGKTFNGIIRAVTVSDELSKGLVTVTIQPDKFPGYNRVGEPVYVQVRHLPLFLHLFMR